MDYIKEPLYVSVVNPLNKNNIRTYYFLGNVPHIVLQAAQNGKFNESEKEMQWKREDKLILKEFYGVNWKEILTGEEPTDMKSGFNLYSTIRGGNDTFGDLTFFDQDNFEESVPEIKRTDLYFIDNVELNSKITYSNVSVYPEDKIYDLRLKVHLITKIPIYRQFLFYYIDNQGPYYTYQISINKIPYVNSWSDMLYDNKLNIGGIGIDAYFEQNKKDIEIISYDLSFLLENKKGHKINRVYIIDLYDILKERDLSSILIDKYQFDLLYYGFIIKYWPQMTPDVFKLSITDDHKKITDIYPKLNNDFVKLYENQTLEQQLINKTYKYFDYLNYSMSITGANMIVYPDIIKMNTNIRNIFDSLELNNNIYAMFINFKHGISKYRYYSKKHASIMNHELYIYNPKDTLSICIKGMHQIILNISKDGSYEILSQWSEDDNISFDNINNTISNYVNPIIKQINNLGHIIFPMGGNLNLLTTSIFTMITVSLYYPFMLTLLEFNNIKNAFKPYEDIGIIRTNGLQVSRTFLFMFNKGITDSNFVYDGYNWLYDNVDIIGRQVRIVHRTDRLQIELVNIKNIIEYDVIKRYIFTIINTYIKENKIKPVKKIDDSKIKSIRKLHDLDPELYNLHKYSDKISAYSVLCQSGRQPVIYDEDSISTLSKEKQNRIVKYWNFTHNKPAYYLCGDIYPHINFITDKHPKGYCLPCCKKLKDTPGTKVAEINQLCLQKRTYQTEQSDMSTYILNYGKKITSGRLCHVPLELSNTFLESDNDKKYYIYGVEQIGNENLTNIGFISSLKFILGNNCINELADFVKNMKQYYTLANGKAGSYNSANELYTEIISNFVSYSNSLLMNSDMNMWHHILTDLVRYKYNVEVINIVDVDGSFHLKTYQDANKSIHNNINISIVMTDENGTNPIIYLNHKEFVKTNKYITLYDSKICKHFFTELNTHNVMNLTFMLSFAKKYLYVVTELYINMSNLCYGIVIEKNNKQIYIPIIASIIPYKNDIPLNYGIYPESNISRNELFTIIKNINDYKKDIIVLTHIVKHKDKYVGFLSADQLVYYYTDHIIVENYNIMDINNMVYEDKKYNIIEFPYNTRDIDMSILQRNINDKLSETALIKKYHNNLYKLFFSEFTTILQKDKNLSIRKKIIHVINETNFMNSKSIQLLIKSLDTILSKYPSDLNSIHTFIEFVYFNSRDLDEIPKIINNSKFEFDFKLLEELRSINDRQLLIKRLHEIMDPFIQVSSKEPSNLPQYYNIYTSCMNKSDQFFCKGSKILIPNSRLNGIFEALANDVINKSKTYLMMIGSSGIFDYLEFIERPYEFIEMSEVKDVL